MPSYSIDLLILQPTPFCNINCRYCYLPDRDDRRRMSVETCRAAFARVFESGWHGRALTVVWHAGEPMAVPPAVYREYFAAADSVRPDGVALVHSFQTNGTLLSEDWCDLIEERGIRVGVSLDGPKDIHDANRRSRSGRGTFDAVMRGIGLLKGRGIGFSVIAVLTRAALLAPERLFEFFEALAPAALCFNVEEAEGAHAASSLAGADAYRLCDAFFRTFWARMSTSEARFAVREFESALGAIVRPAGEEILNSQSTPFSIVSVAHDGRLATYSPEFLGTRHARYGDFSLGNVNIDSLAACAESPGFRRLAADVAAGVDCCRRECNYFDVCGGGAPVNKLTENGTLVSTETMFCRLTKMLPTNLALDLLKQTARCIDAQPVLSSANLANGVHEPC